MPKSIPTLGSANWGQPLNDHLSQLNDPTNGGINKWTTATRPTSLTTNDTGKTGINTGTGDTERWTGSAWEVLTEVKKMQFCDVFYTDESNIGNYLNTSWPPTPTLPQIQTPIYPVPTDTDVLINRKTNKIYKKIGGHWTAFVPEPGYTAVQKYTGSIFQFRPNGANPFFQVTSAHGFINVLDWGTRPDAFGGVTYGTDNTDPIQAAFNYAASASDPGVYGIANGFNGANAVVYFPYGSYAISRQITLSGQIEVRGEGGKSYSGSVISQQTKSESIFVLTPDSDNSANGCGFTDLFLRMNGVGGVACIKTQNNISNNSIYIRNCFFQLSSATGACFGIELSRGDDIQISGCTFDTGSYGIRLGSPTNPADTPFGNTVQNCTVENCTFFGLSTKCMHLVNVSNINITSNRFYANGTTSYTMAIDISSENTKAENINIIGNTIERAVMGVVITNIAKKVNITSNIFTKCTDAAIRLSGGTIMNDLIIQSNQISGNFLPISGQFNSGGAIDGNGCGMTHSIIKDNIIQGNENGTNSTVAINFPDPRTTGNNIKENIIYGFSGPNIIANPAQNVL
jgi:Pectate lyase superfamily protein